MAPSQKSLNRNGAVESTQKAKHFCLLEESVLFGPELVVEKFGVQFVEMLSDELFYELDIELVLDGYFFQFDFTLDLQFLFECGDELLEVVFGDETVAVLGNAGVFQDSKGPCLDGVDPDVQNLRHQAYLKSHVLRFIFPLSRTKPNIS